MHFSELAFRTDHRQAARILASPHRIHATTLNSFSQPLSDTERVLWRLDSGPDRNARLFVVSSSRPNISDLARGLGAPETSAKQADYTAFLDRLSTGQRLRFRLKANTVKALASRTPRGTRGKLVPLSGEDQYLWLEQRAETSGFSIQEHGERTFRIHSNATERFHKVKENTRLNVQLTTAVFDGRLTVTDPAKLRSALTAGIGRAKGYGCGLLTVAPL